MSSRVKNWLKKVMLMNIGAAVGSESPQNDAKASAPRIGRNAHAYFSDQPIRSITEDRFNRWGFAKRIADTLATRTDPASLVVGLFGPWGDGKTSTLHLMEAAL
jgi:hypothetical protein